MIRIDAKVEEDVAAQVMEWFQEEGLKNCISGAGVVLSVYVVWFLVETRV